MLRRSGPWLGARVRAGGAPRWLASLAEFVDGLEHQPKPFGSVLVANRGEIACRVITTAKRMGLRTIAVYSEPEARAKHVRMADEAVCVGPALSADSYLNVDVILDAIKSTGAEAVHPGYGFLSENKLFAEAVEALGVAFVGPPSSAIEAMGDKIMSKQIAIDAGINTIPGFQGVISDEEHAVKVANEVGYPVMIKASAGGGGKGMRIAYTDDQAREGYRLSTEEARSSFGDDRLFIERFIEEPHHIEIQLLADAHDKVVCFPERECSVQRRNQKVLEESPSALLTPEVRLEMCRQAAQLAKAVEYRSAGTVEFLADKNLNFYFLEMNTRLQVEHPVTEYVSGGTDLVEHMLWIAAKHPLPDTMSTEYFAQNIKGWALEARVYAEDPLRGFLPSTGSLLHYSEPDRATQFNCDTPVRVDSGVGEGTDISTHYDPMICKLITHAETRDACIDDMQEALQNYVVRGTHGFAHNGAFLMDVCRNARFRRAETPTSFIEEEYPEGFTGVVLTGDEVTKAAVTAAMLQWARFRRMVTGSTGEVASGGDEGDWSPPDLVVSLTHSGGETTQLLVSMPEVEDEEAEGEQTYESVLQLVDVQTGAERTVRVGDMDWAQEAPLGTIDIEGEVVPFQFQGSHGLGGGTHFCHFGLGMAGDVLPARVLTWDEHALYQHMLPPEVKDTSNQVQSPMPGMLVSLAVEPGQQVEVGQELCVMEAMKMQNVLRAPRAGVIASVHAVPGTSLDVDQLIVSLEPPPQEETTK